jgi:hypothetical protein
MILGANEMGRLIKGQAPRLFQGNPNDNFESDEDDGKDIIEIYFEDAQGNKKKLILEF